MKKSRNSMNKNSSIGIFGSAPTKRRRYPKKGLYIILPPIGGDGDEEKLCPDEESEEG